MQKLAMDEEHYYQTSELITLLESYLLDLSVELTGNIALSKITWENTIKAVGIEFADNYDSFAEKILELAKINAEVEEIVDLKGFQNRPEYSVLDNFILKISKL